MARRCSAPYDDSHLPRLLHQGSNCSKDSSRTASKGTPLSARSGRTCSKSSIPPDAVPSVPSPGSGGRSWCMGGAAARNLRRISMERGLVHEKLQSKQEEELPSFEELSRDLQGWNGRWKKKKASALIQERIRIDELEIEQRRLDIEERHKKAEERREQRRRTIEIEQHELQEEVNRHEARQKAQRLAWAPGRAPWNEREIQKGWSQIQL
ncbi:unnamed protein product [Durusdinium trenchii]|uniref:Uncharacterized protein n=1 Tax=Durusdinium trenchii TaxID=1381693 RepID=A0ABP0KTJ3_9DINO